MFSISGRHNRQITTKRRLNFLAEVVRVVVAQQYNIKMWQIVKIYSLVGPSRGLDSRSEIDMINGAKEGRICYLPSVPRPYLS